MTDSIIATRLQDIRNAILATINRLREAGYTDQELADAFVLIVRETHAAADELKIKRA